MTLNYILLTSKLTVVISGVVILNMHINNLALVIHSVEILNYRLIICNLFVIIPSVGTLNYRLLSGNLPVVILSIEL